MPFSRGFLGVFKIYKRISVYKLTGLSVYETSNDILIYPKKCCDQTLIRSLFLDGVK